MIIRFLARKSLVYTVLQLRAESPAKFSPVASPWVIDGYS